MPKKKNKRPEASQPFYLPALSRMLIRRRWWWWWWL